MAEIPKWKRFERLIHQIHEQYGISGATIILDDRIEGQESKTLRQVDISIRTQIGPYRILIAVECKDHADPLDVGDVGAFASLRDDIRANKGVLVATGGFTPAAVDLARSRGIDTRTYLDTESEDWGTDVTIPILLDATKLLRYNFTFLSVPSPPYLPFSLRTDIPPQLIEVRVPEDAESMPLILLLAQKWNHDDALRVPGEHTVTLCEHAAIDARCGSGYVRIEAQVVVEKRLYSGPLGIHLTGFRDEQNDSILTRKMRTDAIEPGLIERGLAPGWREIEEYRNHTFTTKDDPDSKRLTVNGVPLKAMMVLGYLDALPETRQELGEYQANHA